MSLQNRYTWTTCLGYVAGIVNRRSNDPMMVKNPDVQRQKLTRTPCSSHRPRWFPTPLLDELPWSEVRRVHSGQSEVPFASAQGALHQCQDLLCFFPPSPMDLATLAHLSGVPFLGTAATLRALLASLASTLQLSLWTVQATYNGIVNVKLYNVSWTFHVF